MKKQRIRTVNHYSDPRIPTRDEVDRSPELLRQIPKRWQSNTLVVSALTAALSLMASARSVGDECAKPEVAPIFVHGEGHGAFGCMAINPPEFLSEDEAREVIVEEAKKAGILFRTTAQLKDETRLTNIDVPVTNEKHAPTTSRKGTLYLDGSDAGKRVYFEFVSGLDLSQWLAPEGGATSTAVSHSPIDAARVLREGIAKSSNAGAYAVFYDPAIGQRDAEKAKLYTPPAHDATDVDWDSESAKARVATTQLAREELRKQVHDFIKWLKAQGVI